MGRAKKLKKERKLEKAYDNFVKDLTARYVASQLTNQGKIFEELTPLEKIAAVQSANIRAKKVMERTFDNLSQIVDIDKRS